MKLTSYEKILHIQKYKSFSEAAEHMFLTPQAILRFVDIFESEIGFKIFERSFSGIKLTSAGKIYIEGLKKIQEEQDSLQKKCIAIVKQSNTLHLPLINNSPLFFEGSILPEYKSRYPNVTVDFVTCQAEDIFDSILSGKIDCVHYAKTAYKSDKFEFTPIYPLRQYCIVSKNHPFSKKEYVKYEDLQNEDVFSLSLFLYRYQQEEFEKKGIHIRETNLPYKKVCLENGVYLTTIPDADISNSLVIVPIKESFNDIIGIFSIKNPPQHVKDYISTAQEILSKYSK